MLPSAKMTYSWEPRKVFSFSLLIHCLMETVCAFSLVAVAEGFSLQYIMTWYKRDFTKMSVLIVISDSLIRSVVGLNPRQGSGESSRAEIRKYQCKHEGEIPVLKCFWMLYSEPRKANRIFSFSESITKYCFTALFLDLFSYPSGNQIPNLNTLYLSILF